MGRTQTRAVYPTSNTFVFFFFQAEDGIRDYKVTGVQTCALPIWSLSRPPECPTKPTTVTPRVFAACAARITLGLSPLVEWRDSTSPARARASTWRANTSSNPMSLAHAVSRELSVVSATARRAGRVD